MKNYLIGLFIILIITIIYLIIFIVKSKSLFTYLKLKKELNENKDFGNIK